MAFQTGKSGNPKGRKKGSKNKTPEEIRQLIQNFIERNIDTLQTDFDKLSPDKKLQFIEKLFSHVLPKPMNELERLTDEQLDEIINRLRNKKNE